MKEEKLREKYPNIKNEEDFEKLRTILKRKNNKALAALCSLVLLVLGALLYRTNSIIAVICIVSAVVIWWLGESRWGKHIDEFFLAIARRKTVDNRVVLNQESVQQALKKYTIKEIWFDFIASELFGFLCMIVWCFILMFLGEDNIEIPALIFFVMIPLAAFGVFRIGAIIKRRKTKNAPYILLHTKVADRNVISSSDPESNSENYYFVFNCANYGMLDYEVSSYGYHSVFVGRDEYYLVVVKRRFSKKHKIATIFFAEEYVLSPELEKLVKTV